MGTNKRFYIAKANSWGMGETSKGAPQIVVQFDIITDGAAESRLTWYGSFSDKSGDRTVESLRHCGWTGDDLMDVQGLDLNEVELVVEDEEYEGKIGPKVQWVNRAGGVSIKTPLVGDKLKAFAASMKGRIRALDASKGIKPAARQGPPEPPPLGDADIPF